MADTDAQMADPSTALSEWQNALADALAATAAWKQDLARAVAPFQTADDPAGPGLDDALTDAEAQLSEILNKLEIACQTLMESYETTMSGQTGDDLKRLQWQRAEQARTHRIQQAKLSDDGQAAVVAGPPARLSSISLGVGPATRLPQLWCAHRGRGGLGADHLHLWFVW